MNAKLIAGASGALAVALAAFGAHGLKGKVSPELMDTWKTAAQFHLINSAALASMSSRKPPSTAFQLLLVGTAIFSGSLYALVLTEVKKLGAITPIGGVLMIAAWLAFAMEKDA